ncbi:MAG: hypothetical protein ABL934_14205 [Lysobacteraceae bacterium]
MPTTTETREPDEAAMTAEMIDMLRRKMAQDYEAGHTRRDAHPKATGLLRGRFEVESDLPKHLRVGLFAKAQTCDCWIRTSNSSGKPQSDAIGDARGFAIKLMAPGGTRKDETPLGQDFVLLSTPVMPLGTVALFRDAVYYTIESSVLLFAAKCVLGGHARALLGLAALRIRPTSPLDIRYWSTTPYRFGKGHAVKYSLIPTSRQRSSMPKTPGESYLSEAMQRHLDKHEASFDFCVQLQQDGMPIEDAAPRWDETASPFLKVATLRIPKQKFRTAQRDALAESLAFSPGHALPAHAPLGGLNRARIKIYRALSKFRHTRDARAQIA